MSLKTKRRGKTSTSNQWKAPKTSVEYPSGTRQVSQQGPVVTPANHQVLETEKRLIERVEDILRANPRRSITDTVRLVSSIEMIFPSMLPTWLAYRQDCWRPELGSLRDVRVEGYDLYIAATQTLKLAELGPPLPTDKECYRWLRSQGFGPFASFATVCREAKRLIKDLDCANATPVNERSHDQEQRLVRYPLAVFHLCKFPSL